MKVTFLGAYGVECIGLDWAPGETKTLDAARAALLEGNPLFVVAGDEPRAKKDVKEAPTDA